MPTTDLLEQHYQRGNALRMRGEFAEAEKLFRDVLRRSPGHQLAAYSLASMLREDGRLMAAADVVASLWDNHPGGVREALEVLGFLVECGAYERAQVVADEARTRWPDVAPIAAKAGEISLALGAFDTAAVALRDAADRDQAQGGALLRLAYCSRYTSHTDADLRRFERVWLGGDAGANARLCAGFALAKALDDLGDYARAAGVLRQANQLACTVEPWNVRDWNRLVDMRMQSALAPTHVADPDFVPVFVVGLPRTGTTMIAAALGRIEGVRDRGELNWVGAMYAHLQAHGQLRDGSAMATVSRTIQAQMRRDDAPARFYVDQNPMNFRNLDMIAALFPRAKVICCRRGSRDTALSLWMHIFASADMAFSSDFTTIAEVERDCGRLMDHWRRSLGVDMIDVDYEGFVANPAEKLRELASFIGAAGRVVRPAATGAIAATASVWQVRQPVYTHSVGRWRRYASFVPELTALFAGSN